MPLFFSLPQAEVERATRVEYAGCDRAGQEALSESSLAHLPRLLGQCSRCGFLRAQGFPYRVAAFPLLDARVAMGASSGPRAGYITLCLQDHGGSQFPFPVVWK